MKLLIRLGLVVAAVLVIVVIAAVILVDSIATAAVRTGVGYATETDTECEKIDVKLFGSSADIRRLDIKNPDGPIREKFDSFLIVETGTAEVSAGSVLSDTIEIPKVELTRLEMTLVGIDGKKNYEMILESLGRFQDKIQPEETKDQKKLMIKKLIISNITVHYYFDADPALGAIEMGPKTVVIADKTPIVLENVGVGGAPVSQVASEVITSILVKVMVNLSGELGGHIKGLGKALVDTLGENKLTEAISEVSIGDGLKDLGSGISDLFSGDDDEQGTDTEDSDAEEDGIGSRLRNLVGGDDE